MDHTRDRKIVTSRGWEVGSSYLLVLEIFKKRQNYMLTAIIFFRQFC